MAIRRSSIIYIVVGVILVVAAAVVRFVVVPTATKLPTDLDVTVEYAGTGTLLNPEAVQGGDAANLLTEDAPVSILRHIYVSNAEGDVAVTHDDMTVKAPGMSLPSNHTYAIDRRTMQAADAPAGIDVQKHSGITIGLPVNPDADAAYALYDFATQQQYPMNPQGKDAVEGRDVLRYTVAASGALRDEAILGALPPALPKAQLASLAGALPATARAELTPEVVAALPDPVPFSYSSATKYDLSVDAVLGTPADGTIDQQVIAQVMVGDRAIDLLPVLAMRTSLTDASRSDAAATASSASFLLTAMAVVVPIVLLLLGAALILLGIGRRRVPSRGSGRATSGYSSPNQRTEH